MHLRIIAADGTDSTQVVTASTIRLGRDPACEVCFDSALYPTVSGRHAKIERNGDSCVVVPLSQTNRTLLNDQAIEGATPVKVGDRIRLGGNGPTVEVTAIPPLSAAAEAKPGSTDKGQDSTVMAGDEDRALLQASVGSKRLRIGQGGVIGRVMGHVDFVLDHAHVSRRHAHLTVEGEGESGRVLLHDLGSANGTFVNGKRITRQVELQRGDRIDIGPFSLQFDGQMLVSRSRSDNIELVARDVARIVKDRNTGKPLALLDGVSLVIRPREFVCLLGPSGSGKTTLLSALSGRSAPDNGCVLVNNADLHANFEAMKQDIAVVPQKDALHESLAVEQALWYTAKLRLPPDTMAAEIETSLAEMLNTVGLTERRSTMIRHLSGGQIKRASLANEILCKPSLLFLDEVTSGLDEQTDREVMDLFQSLAKSGKTVVCITHSLTNVERSCDLVVILTAGGKLAFVGAPAEALEYFDIKRLGDVYDRLKEQPAESWQASFLKSPHWQRYVADRMPAETEDRAVDPSSHGHRYGAWFVRFLRQSVLLTSRYAAIWRGDYPSLLAMVGQALVVAVLLILLYGGLDSLPLETPADKLDHAQRTVNLLFLVAVSSFWFGCNNAAKEIVKERTIYTRERDFNLLIGSYYVSKLLLLTAFSCLQTILLFTIVKFSCGPPGPFLTELSVVLMLSFAGVTTGLTISAAAASEDMAVTLMPMVVIPQIILSGSISKLEGVGEMVAMIIISTFWGKRGLDACLPESVAQAYPQGLEQHSATTAVLVLLLQAFGGIVIALAVLYVQSLGRRGGVKRKAR